MRVFSTSYDPGIASDGPASCRAIAASSVGGGDEELLASPGSSVGAPPSTLAFGAAEHPAAAARIKANPRVFIELMKLEEVTTPGGHLALPAPHATITPRAARRRRPSAATRARPESPQRRRRGTRPRRRRAPRCWARAGNTEGTPPWSPRRSFR